MAKNTTYYVCSQCTYQTIKWLGCCPECKEWNTFTEQTTHSSFGSSLQAKSAGNKSAALHMQSLSTISTTSRPRMYSGIQEWDSVVGGGLMPDSLVVLTGDPGIGKSTLLLQICNALARAYKVYYFSTEESLLQVKIRADRLACTQEKLLFSDNAYLDAIMTTCESAKPDIVVIDSIQNCYQQSSQAFPGTVNHLRESTFQLMRLAKEKHITVIMTGHITKEGIIAGPKTLEHMVDAVFYLQGDDRLHIRMLRAVKNRFGTIDELGFFQMGGQGLEQVPDINAELIKSASQSPGSVLISELEGSRALLLELQALVVPSKLAMPQRVISGIDQKQVVLIAAILEKYLHIKLSTFDIFLKVSGGFKIKSSSVDMGIALALLSSYFQQPVPGPSLCIGEINLTGKIQPINYVNTYIKEAERFGINTLLVSYDQKIDTKNCRKRGFKSVYDLLSLFDEK